MTLNPDQFFHGTTANIKDGMVRPANDADKHVSEYSMGDPGDMSEGDHAFVSKNDEQYAWHAAMNFHKNGARPRVYETEPAADMKPGPWNKEHPDFLAHHEIHTLEVGGVTYAPDKETVEEAHKESQPEYGSPTGFKIKNRIDIAPGHQGTFPGTNWNSYRRIQTSDSVGYHAPRNQQERVIAMRSGGRDLNHPSDTDIAYGTGNTAADAQEKGLSEHQPGHNWRKDAPKHSELREMSGRPQRQWATLF